MYPAFMAIPLGMGLGLLMMLSQGHVQAAPQSQQNYQVSPGASSARDSKSGPRVDRGMVIRTLAAHREDFMRRTFSTTGPSLEIGERLPDNAESEQLPDSVKQALPRYEGYAWRRIGNDVVLIGIASDTFYEIFPDVLREPGKP